MINDDAEPDSELTPNQRSLIGQLSDADIQVIESALLEQTSDKWQKVAKVVGMAMPKLTNRVKGIPDVYYSKRVQMLVQEGLLECKGDLSCMRYSEVRQPRDNET